MEEVFLDSLKAPSFIASIRHIYILNKVIMGLIWGSTKILNVLPYKLNIFILAG